MSDIRRIQGHIDAVDPVLSGWVGFSPDTVSPGDGSLTLSLMAGDERLAGVPRTVARPDVDAFLGYAGLAKGFTLPVAAIAGFLGLTGGGDLRILMEADAAVPTELPVTPARAGASPLALVQPQSGWRLRDMWFASARRLSLRFERNGTAPGCRLAAFQRSVTAGGGKTTGLVRLPVTGSLSDVIGVVTLDLFNPFLPVLFLLRDESDAIVASDWIAFPSFVRGGLHAAEVQALGTGADPIEDMVRLSDRFAAAIPIRRTAEIGDRLRCDTLRIDPTGCTGTEPIFDPDLLDMLTRFIGVTVSVVSGSGEAEATLLATLLAAQVRDAQTPPDPDAVSLLIPGDAVPTLSALLDPYLRDTGPEQRPPAFVRILDGLDPQSWLVTPGRSASPRTGPALSAPAGTADIVTLAAPVAIRFSPAPTRMAQSMLFPTAVDSPRRPVDHRPITAVIGATHGDGPPLALLQSIAEQDGFADGQILYSLIFGQPREPVEAALNTLFEGRHQIIVHGARHARIRDFRGVAGFAAHATVILLDPETVLQDSRTFATLAAELDDAAVGTASCLLVHPDGASARFAAAGYFLNGVSLRSLPTMLFDTPDTTRILDSRYDVAAAPIAALAVRRDTLMAIGPVAASTLHAIDEVRLGLDMLRAGLRNVVVTDISVTTTRADLATPAFTVSLPFSIGAAMIERIASESTVLQRL